MKSAIFRKLRTVRKTPKIGNYTAKTCLEELQKICSKYKKAKKGYHAEFRSSMEQTQRVLDRLHRNLNLQKDFRRLVVKKQKENGSSSANTFNLSLEAVAYATGAFTRKARQIASKRARVLDYLRKIDVPPGETAATIKSKGGIEKIYQELLAKERMEKTERAEEHGGGKRRNVTKKQVNKKRPVLKNDVEIPISITMMMSDRDAILRSKVGTSLLMKGEISVGGSIKVLSITLDTVQEDDWD